MTMNKSQFVQEWNKQKLEVGKIIDIAGSNETVDLFIGYLNGNMHDKYYSATIVNRGSKQYGLQIAVEANIEKLGSKVFERLNPLINITKLKWQWNDSYEWACDF